MRLSFCEQHYALLHWAGSWGTGRPTDARTYCACLRVDWSHLSFVFSPRLWWCLPSSEAPGTPLILKLYHLAAPLRAAHLPSEWSVTVPTEPDAGQSVTFVTVLHFIKPYNGISTAIAIVSSLTSSPHPHSRDLRHKTCYTWSCLRARLPETRRNQHLHTLHLL